MPSKRSFFNRTLFRKNLGRFWPLWGGVSLAGAMLPIYMLLGLLGGQMGQYATSDEFAYTLYQAATIFAPAFTFCYAILCAIAVWGYLYNSRSVGLMHTLPVDRTCLFVTNTLSGLAMVLLPYAVVGLLICLIALFWGFFDLMAVVYSVVAVLLLAALFFGLATLCAMLTGHAFVLPAFYLLSNFLATLLELLVSNLSQNFLLGVTFEGPGRFAFLSPLIQIYSSFHAYGERLADGSMSYSLSGLGTVALYGLAGLALLVLAWFLYHRRQSESAGDVVAFRWLRPVFRYGVALLSGLTVGRVLYELLWGQLFQRGRYADMIPMCLCMAAAGVLGYYAASMLLEKSLRVFRRSWPGVATVCAGAVILCAMTSMDIFGAERWVPDPEDVAQIRLADYRVSMDFGAAEPELVRQIVAAHEAIVADREYIRSGYPGRYERGKAASHYIRLTYTLKDGRTVRRDYDLWVTAERAANPETFDGRLLSICNDPLAIRQRVALPEGADIAGSYVYSYGSSYISDESLGIEESKRLYDAILQDAAAGNVPAYDLLNDGVPSYDFRIEFEYSLWTDENAYGHRFFSTEMYPTMDYTLRTLEELGCLTAEDLAEMDEDLREAYADWELA